MGYCFENETDALQLAYVDGVIDSVDYATEYGSKWLLPIHTITAKQQPINSSRKVEFLANIGASELNDTSGIILKWDGEIGYRYNDGDDFYTYVLFNETIYATEEMEDGTAQITSLVSGMVTTVDTTWVKYPWIGSNVLESYEDGVTHTIAVNCYDPSLTEYPEATPGFYLVIRKEDYFTSQITLPSAKQLEFETIEQEEIVTEPTVLFEEEVDFTAAEVSNLEHKVTCTRIRVDSNGLYAKADGVWRGPLLPGETDFTYVFTFENETVPSATLQNWLMHNGEVLLGPGDYKFKLAPISPFTPIQQELFFVFKEAEESGLGDYITAKFVANFSGIFITPYDDEPFPAEGDPIYFLWALIVNFDVPFIPLYIDYPFGTNNFSTWLVNGLRDIAIPEEQYVSWAFSDWFLTNQEKQTKGDTISFKIDGEVCEATRGIDWNFWLRKQKTELDLQRSTEEYLFKDGFLVSRAGKDVKTEQAIVENSHYEITPQIKIKINPPKGVYHNLFFAKRLKDEYVLRPNKTYKIPFTCEDGFHLEPKVSFLSDYLSYSIQNNTVTIITEDFPTNFREIPTFTLPIKPVKVYCCKMIEEPVESTGTTLVKMEPQYAVRIEGDYYISQGGPYTTNYTADNYQDKKIVGVTMPFLLILAEAILGTILTAMEFLRDFFEDYTESEAATLDWAKTYDDSIIDGINILTDEELFETFLRNVFSEGVPCMTDIMHVALQSFRVDPTLPDKLYLFGSYMEDVYNQKTPVEDILGQTMYVIDQNPTKRDNAIASIIDLLFQESDLGKIRLEEMSAAAEEMGVTLEEYFELCWQQLFGRRDVFATFYAKTIDKEMLEEIKDWLNNNPKLYEQMLNFNNLADDMQLNAFTKILQEEPILAGMLSTSVMYSTKEKADIIYSVYEQGTPEQESIFHGLLNKGKKVRERVIFSDENDFDFEVPESLALFDGERLEIVGNYVPPKNRYTPGHIELKTYVNILCLSGDTLITLGDGTKKRIDELSVGEKVLTPKGAEEILFSDSQSKKIKNTRTEYYFEDGTKLTIIKDHRVYSPSKNKFVCFSKLKIGDCVLREDGTSIRLIKKVQITGEDIQHYTLFTENENAYYANGILCGNRFSNIKNSFLRKGLLQTIKKIGDGGIIKYV